MAKAPSEENNKPVNRKAGKSQSGRARPSMADVAQHAGCSQSTVSIVLNNTPGIKIGDSTRKRVMDAVQNLGYSIPHRRASGIVEAAPVAFVVDRLSTSIEAILSIEAAREAITPSGRVLLVAETLDDAAMEQRVLETLLSQGTTAIIYATNHTRKVDLPKILYDTDVPVVLLNCYTDDCAFPTVVPSEIVAGMSGTQHLLDAGHSRIAIITGELWMEAAASRLTGYRRTLATADILFDSDLVRTGNWRVDSGRQQTLALLDLPNPPTAIFCSSDRMAVGCMQAIHERGLRIPEEISVLGFDNEDISHHVVPLLSTIQLPQAEMGEWAVEHIISIKGPRNGLYRKVKLECRLIERDSVGPPPKST